MPAKVCPRCGAQYANLKSTTCPQCFAVLVPVDDATAAELAAARAAVEHTPEFQEAKAADDERFKEQSFGACLGVAAITLLTLIVAVVLISAAAHRRHAPIGIAQADRRPAPSPAPQTWGGGAAPEPLTTLPVAAATLGEVFPPAFGPCKRLASDQATVLTGTLTPLFHGVYARPGEPPLDVYALPAGRPTTEQNEFRLGLTLAAQVGGERAGGGDGARPLLFFATVYWHFAALAARGRPAAPPALRDALAATVRGS